MHAFLRLTGLREPVARVGISSRTLSTDCGGTTGRPASPPRRRTRASSVRRLFSQHDDWHSAAWSRDQTLADFFRSHNVRYQSATTRRINAIRSEEILTTDPAVVLPMRLLVEALLPQLRAVNAAIQRFDEEIAGLCPQLPDYELFRSLPGAGATLAPRPLVAFGERRNRYPDAASLQMYAGIAPVTERHQAALRALAFKWIRILHRCWVERTPYDEARYLLALQKRQAPLLRFAAEHPS